MAKWADFLISHVRKNDGVITHVVLHTDNEDSVSNAGVVKTEAEVIALLKAGQTIRTIIWGYPNWSNGAEVSYVRGTYREYLRTDRDKTAKDNLDNMIPMYN